MAHNRHLRTLANAFQELATTANPSRRNQHIMAFQFAHACRLVDPSNFGFGPPFMFAAADLLSKVETVERAARSQNETLQDLVDRDMRGGRANRTDSPSRSLVRLKRAIEMVRVIFEQVLENEGSDSLVDPITIAYTQVFSPYHGSSIREAFATISEQIPSLYAVLNTLNETEASARDPMESYIAASRIVAQHIESVLSSYELGARLLILT